MEWRSRPISKTTAGKTADACLFLFCCDQAVPHVAYGPRPGPGSLPVGPPCGGAAGRAQAQTAQQTVWNGMDLRSQVSLYNPLILHVSEISSRKQQVRLPMILLILWNFLKVVLLSYLFFGYGYNSVRVDLLSELSFCHCFLSVKCY